MLLLLDNYDSFTFNLVQALRALGTIVEVRRNDELDLPGLRRLAPDGIVISPGPGGPAAAGLSQPLVAASAAQMPILGVCLGHQAIGAAFGARIVRARAPMHGKVSPIHHDGRGVYVGLPTPFAGTRYHSLVVDGATLPDELEVSAWTVDDEGRPDEIMGIRHRHRPVEGVQIHPEAILTTHGQALLENFVRAIEQRRGAGTALP